ncbi:hypothetical protein NW863_07890, partial [Synechococcus sp. B60.1]|uniref:hypothetical protein n=1 Tax=Synechococcus sp. B60.1 TaxID=2964522 RepID=UPI0039C044D4
LLRKIGSRIAKSERHTLFLLSKGFSPVRSGSGSLRSIRLLSILPQKLHFSERILGDFKIIANLPAR